MDLANGNILEIDAFNSLLAVNELSVQWSSALGTIQGFAALTSVHNIQINRKSEPFHHRRILIAKIHFWRRISY